VTSMEAAVSRPEGAGHTSPGQRPGSGRRILPEALKGRYIGMTGVSRRGGTYQPRAKPWVEVHRNPEPCKGETTESRHHVAVIVEGSAPSGLQHKKPDGIHPFGSCRRPPCLPRWSLPRAGKRGVPCRRNGGPRPHRVHVAPNAGREQAARRDQEDLVVMAQRQRSAVPGIRMASWLRCILSRAVPVGLLAPLHRQSTGAPPLEVFPRGAARISPPVRNRVR
jgi:hypothetical protein